MSKIALNSNASGTGVFTIASPNSDTDRTLTLPDASGTVVSENASGDVAVTGDITSNGNAVITTQSPQLGRRNLIINGAMQVAQRGTSFTGVSSNAYNVDRMRCGISGVGTYTITQSTDSPNGFANSLRIECTTSATPASNGYFVFGQILEGQNLQQLQKGTATAKSITVSFWVKSVKTGTHIFELYDADNTRSISKTYNINSANTWEYKTITIEGDSSGSLDNDNQASIYFNFWLAAGTDFSSGTLSTSWASVTNADRAAGTPNYADTVGNTWQVTGFQIELGDVATPFEYRSYGEELALCQRYFYKAADQAVYSADYGGGSFTRIDFPVTMRATPTVTATNSKTVLGAYHSTQSIQFYLNANAGNMSPNATADAEL
jgi:hypothetical protein